MTDTRRDEGKRCTDCGKEIGSPGRCVSCHGKGQPAHGEREECARTVFPWWDDVMPSARLDLAVNSALAMLEQHDAARQASAAEIEELSRLRGLLQMALDLSSEADDGEIAATVAKLVDRYTTLSVKESVSAAEIEAFLRETGKQFDSLGTLKRAMAERDELKRDNRTQAAEIERLANDRDRALKGICAVAILIEESSGVAGLHLNGDDAPWGELRTGGRFEDWLRDFDTAMEDGEAKKQINLEHANNALRAQLKQAEAEVAELSRQVLEAHAKLESAHAETSAAEAERDATRDDRSTTGDCR